MKFFSIFSLISKPFIGLLFNILIGILASSPSFAAYQWGFGDVSINHLAWDQGTQNKSTKRDFNYVELEGGAQFNWGELYGFYDSENVGKPGDEIRSAAKASVRYYLGQSKLSLYAHAYTFSALGFSEQNRIFGLGYQLAGEQWSFKPFLGAHEVIQTYFNGMNGFMGGWTLIYNFKIAGQNFMAIDWHEIEFERNQLYAAGNGNSKIGHNGAASIWWSPIPETSAGLQWRYASDKLGTPGSMNAFIASLKYNF